MITKFPKIDRPRIAVDFDGVICAKDQIPIEGAKEALSKLFKKYYLIIFTARENRVEVKYWLRAHDMRFNEITNIKQNNIKFWIDDHAIQFKDWNETLNTVL